MKSWRRFRLKTLWLLTTIAALSAMWVGSQVREPETPDAFFVANLKQAAGESLSAAQLLAHLGLDSRNKRARPKRLASHHSYLSAKKEKRFVFLYDPSIISFPGNNESTVVIADQRHRLLSWKKVGSESVLISSECTVGPAGNLVLALKRGHRAQGIGASRWLFALQDDQVPLVDIEWRDSTGTNPAQENDGWQWSRDFIRATALGKPTDDLMNSLPILTY